MRKLKLQVQMTVDGFIGGPNGEMDWLVMDWDDEIKQYVQALTDPVDTIVLGRKLAEGFIPHWAGVAASPENPEQEAGKKYSETPKVVFSRTLGQSQWENTRIAKSDLVQEITQLKAQNGSDIIAYGGASFVSALIKEGLIDEYYLFINPVAIGTGLPIFNELIAQQHLKLVHSRSFTCGIIVLHYQLKKA